MNAPITIRDPAMTEALESPPRRTPAWLIEALVRLPLIAVSLYVCVMAFDSLSTLGFRQYPLTSWESSFTVQAAALARGDAIYFPPSEPDPDSRLAMAEGDPNFAWLYHGPAANMYGPAVPHVLSWAFKFVEPTIHAGRIMTAVGAALLLVLGYFVLPRRTWSSPTALLALVALVLANHLRARAFFSEIRPDVVALVLFGIGLGVLWWCHDRRRFGLYPLGLALLVGAFLFKQTVAPLTAVPFLGVLLARPSGWWRTDIWLTLLCPVVILATVQFLKVVFPNIYYYAFFMPTQWRFLEDRYWYAPWNAIVFFPIILVALGLLAALPKRLADTRVNWLLAATVVGWLAACVYWSKRGGSFNSYLNAWLPGSLLCAVVIGLLITEKNLGERLRYWSVVLLMPVALLASTFGVFKSNYFANDGGLVHGSDDWASIIDLIERLPGEVTCPEDPTITLFGRDRIEATLQTETDAVANER
ncbi:MAG: hypothetical protein AAF743_07165, partial [Planctomycetota bacterium]